MNRNRPECYNDYRREMNDLHAASFSIKYFARHGKCFISTASMTL